MSASVFSVAVFRAGRIGNAHARNIADHDESRVKYVVDPVTAAAEALAQGRCAGGE